MKHSKSICFYILILFFLFFHTFALADNKQVYAVQGNVAFFRENGKIGLQSADGLVLHEAEFDGASYFDETQQASVFAGDKVGRIDRSGNVAVEPFLCDSITAIPTGCVAESDPAYVLLVTWYDTAGQKTMQLMTVEGKWISDVRFDLMMYGFHNGKLFIRSEGKYNQIDVNSRLTSDEWWDYLFVNDLNDSEATETNEKGYLYFNNDGDIWAKDIRLSEDQFESYLIHDGTAQLVPASWTNLEWINKDYVAYCENGLWGVADYEGNVILQAQMAHSPRLINEEEGIWEILNPQTQEWEWRYSDGKTVLTLQPDESMEYVLEGRYFVYSDNKDTAKLLDNTGKIITEFESKYFAKYEEENNLSRYVNAEDGTWGFINSDGQILCEIPDSLIEYLNGYTILTNGWFRVMEYDESEDTVSGKCGYVSVSGDILLSDEWTSIRDFAMNQLACVRTDSDYGYINNCGEYAITPQWEYADSFFSTGSQWLAPVYKTSDSKIVWQGFINEKNELIGERAVSDAESVRILHELLDSAK